MTAASVVVRQQPPILDVRAPAEFELGAVPGAINLPILDDEQREQVGTIYKQAGNAAATELGHKLVHGPVRRQRLEQWATYLKDNPDAHITCWRGGQRSAIAQQWLAENGIHAPRIQGGYKALRSACLATLDEIDKNEKQTWVLAGRTGTKKTVIINAVSNSIDLEGIANHRGSAFGAMSSPQPALATFENTLAYAWVNHQSASLVLEDESRTIGRVAVPQRWHAQMGVAPLVLVESTLEERVEHIYQEYVAAPLAAGKSELDLATQYRAALTRIKRRLGGVRHAHIDELIANTVQEDGSHQSWISELLTDYYDPMYDYQLAKKLTRIRFTGDKTAVIEFLSSLPR